MAEIQAGDAHGGTPTVIFGAPVHFEVIDRLQRLFPEVLCQLRQYDRLERIAGEAFDELRIYVAVQGRLVGGLHVETTQQRTLVEQKVNVPTETVRLPKGLSGQQFKFKQRFKKNTLIGYFVVRSDELDGLPVCHILQVFDSVCGQGWAEVDVQDLVRRYRDYSALAPEFYNKKGIKASRRSVRVSGTCSRSVWSSPGRSRRGSAL